MSRQIQLVPELQQLIDDFVSVRNRFIDLTEAFVAQKLQLQKQQIELENSMKQIATMQQKQSQYEAITKSYNQLKLDYELLHSATENHRDEIHAENKKRVQDLEEELKRARAKCSQQAELHRSTTTQIITDYEAKLRDADEKVRQLSRCGTNTPKATGIEETENISSVSNRKYTGSRGGKKRWPQLAVEIGSRGSGSRGRGRARGGQSKRKLFKLDDEGPVDVE